MRGFVLSVASIAVVLIASASADPVAPASTSPAPASASAQAPLAASDPDKVECRTLAAKTGSRLGGRRECRTAREWDDIRHQNEHELEKMQARDSLVHH